MDEGTKFVKFVVLEDLEKRNVALAAALKSANEETKKLTALLHEERMDKVILTKNQGDVIERLEADKEILLRRLEANARSGEVKQQQETEMLSRVHDDVQKLRRHIAVLKAENMKVKEDRDRLKSQLVSLKREVKEAQEGEAKARLILRFHKSKQRNPEMAPTSGMIFGDVGGVQIIQNVQDEDSITLLPITPITSPLKNGRTGCPSVKRSSPRSKLKRVQSAKH